MLKIATLHRRDIQRFVEKSLRHGMLPNRNKPYFALSFQRRRVWYRLRVSLHVHVFNMLIECNGRKWEWCCFDNATTFENESKPPFFQRSTEYLLQSTLDDINSIKQIWTQLLTCKIRLWSRHYTTPPNKMWENMGQYLTKLFFKITDEPITLILLWIMHDPERSGRMKIVLRKKHTKKINICERKRMQW